MKSSPAIDARRLVVLDGAVNAHAGRAVEVLMSDILKLGAKGELVLPRRVRAELGLREGDELLLTLDDDTIVIKRKARRFVEYLDNLRRTSSGRPRS